MKIVFLDATTMGNDIDLELFQQFGIIEAFETTTVSERVEHISDAKIILTNKVVIDKEVMDACPNLGLICITATGTNNVDLEYAKEKGIVVKNVAGYSTASVAQTTMMLVLNLLGQCGYYNQFVKSGQWTKTSIFTHLDRSFWEIKGKRWGIVGLGTIGKEVAKIASAFGANVVYFSTSGTNNDSNYERVSLEVMMQTCDVISIHAPLNDKTKNLIAKEQFNQMKKSAILVNVGRGGIINEDDLREVIDTKEIYVGLDVLAVEPMIEHHPLLHVKHPERLIITPHIAWGSIEARRELMRQVGENIKEYLRH
ncbi:D-2-hydroxyacid dehydrogenase [Sulfurospirillum diekertiae]|uniref:2-hydroxyacid dehydrogenase n=1 Tax=Sulfurospirillum diekertiae TaxID=1854492 RepID=A0A1Y0HIX2_9BACT|nr:D-2-hydroxyacid dehydrogenase [Sulfurospirillum diekertiae]ARU47305.1 Putative 2-hydroxyacid dehydrogenase [Sulfurospirillum diekertiae]ASC92158.1 Putative 2-hydroxyacid dehydrogenase [Sulfurospirillum diekertiae]